MLDQQGYFNKKLEGFFRLELGYKLYLMFNLLMLILIGFNPQWTNALINSVELVGKQQQFWRLITSFMTNGGISFESVAYLLFALWMLWLTMAELECRYSTVYILIELLKQVFILNLIVVILFYPLLFFEIVNGQQVKFEIWGITIPLINFSIQSIGHEPDGIMSICGLSFPFKRKYLSFIVFITVVLFNVSNLWISITLYVICMCQHWCKKKPFLAFPLKFYRKMNALVPQCIKDMRGFIDFDSVKSNLVQVCQNCCGKNQQMVIQNKKVKHTKQQQFKHHWINKQIIDEQEIEVNKEENQIKITPMKQEIKIKYQRQMQPQVTPIPNVSSSELPRYQQQQQMFDDNIVPVEGNTFGPGEEKDYKNFEDELELEIEQKRQQNKEEKQEKVSKKETGVLAGDDEQQWY